MYRLPGQSADARVQLASLKRKEHADRAARGQPHKEIHRNADFQEIAELTVSGTINQRVGLITDGGRKAGASGNHDGHGKRARIDAKF